MQVETESNSTSHIYDKIFKKVLTLSSKAVINFINGLFETNYATDAKVMYNWTEFQDDNLKKVLADTIITIDGCHSYHMEAQRYQDKTIIFRVFEYGYRHAERYKELDQGKCYLHFPEPKIIYLYAEGEIPNQYTLELDFGKQGTFEYEVATVQLKDISVQELNDRKMIILIPFYLLSLQKMIREKRSKENLEQLKRLIFHDILGNIEANYECGNITIDDASRLKNLTIALYRHLYAKYREMEDINDMTDESLILEYDIFLKKHNIESLDETVTWIEEERKYIAESHKKIEDSKREIEDGKREIEDGKREIEDGKREIEDGKREIADGKKEIADSKKEIEDRKKEIEQERIAVQKEKEEIIKMRKEMEQIMREIALNKDEMKSV